MPDMTVRAFASSGDMLTNNWKENKDGQSYIQRIGAAGRSDVLGWARDFLAPRIDAVNADFAKRYGWGPPSEPTPSDPLPGTQESLQARWAKMTPQQLGALFDDLM